MVIRGLLLAGFLLGSCACLAEEGATPEPASQFKSDEARKAETTFLGAVKAAMTKYGTDLAAVLTALKEKLASGADSITKDTLQKEAGEIGDELVRLHAEITGNGNPEEPRDIKTEAARKAAAEYQAAVKRARAKYLQDLLAARRTVLGRKHASADPAIKEGFQKELDTIDQALAPLRGGSAAKPPAPSTINEIVIEALIDGDSELWVKADGIFWHQGGGSKPGQHEGKNEPTLVDGKPWLPEWDSPNQSRLYPMAIGKVEGKLTFELELIAVGANKGCKGIEHRDPIITSTRPDAFVVSIPDSQGGSQWYRFRLYRAGDKPGKPGKSAHTESKEKP